MKSSNNWPNETGASANLNSFTLQLREQEAAGNAWKTKYTQAVQQALAETARTQAIRTLVGELQAKLSLHEQRLSEKNDHIAALQRQIDALESVQREMAGQARMVDEKEEEISRLRKRLVEVRAALRIRTDGGVALRPVLPAGNQLSLQIGKTTPSMAPPKDNLKEIRGIGPAFERVLNKMGIVTFRQIAQWDATDAQADCGQTRHRSQAHQTGQVDHQRKKTL